MRSSTDNILLEHAYYQVFTEQQRLLEEGKILDFIKKMGGKLRNAFDIINLKIASNPKLFKTLAIAGPILASLAAKNFDKLSVSSDIVKDLLETLNGVDPNISAEDLQDVLSNWDQEHAGNISTYSGNPEGAFSTTDINIGQEKDGVYSFSGETLNTTGKEMGDSTFVETYEKGLESIATNSDLSTVIKNFTCSVVKTTQTDGSGASSLLQYSGTISASSPEEAIKIMAELVKAAIKDSNIDINNLKLSQPQASLLAAESFYHIHPSEYLLEFQMFDKLKGAVKGASSKVASKVKNIVVGAKNLADRIKKSFKKAPNTPEQQFKVEMNVQILPKAR